MFQSTNQLMNMCWIYHDKVDWIWRNALSLWHPTSEYVEPCWATATTERNISGSACAHAAAVVEPSAPGIDLQQVVGVLPGCMTQPSFDVQVAK